MRKGLGLFILMLLVAGYAGAAEKIIYDGLGDTWKMNPDGSNNLLLERNAEGMSYCPDGEHIVFSTWRWDDPIGNSELAVMDSDGTNVVRLTSDGYALIGDRAPDCRSDDTIVWLRGGRHLTGLPGHVFVWSTIMIMDVDGSNLIPLYEGQRMGDVSWLGDNIVFTKRDGANGYQIYRMGDDGSGVTKLTSFTTDHPWHLDGSQDGQYITYSRPVTPTDSEIWIMGKDGTNQTVVTADDDYNKNPNFDYSAQNICFVSKGKGPYFQVHRIKVNGTKEVVLTSNGFDARECDWGAERFRW